MPGKIKECLYELLTRCDIFLIYYAGCRQSGSTTEEVFK